MMVTTRVFHHATYLGIGLLAGVLLAGHLAPLTPSALAQRIATACGTATPTAKPPITTPSTSKGHTITVKLSNHLWRLTFTGVAIRPTVHSTYESHTAKGKYVIVYLTAQNLDKKPHELAFDVNLVLIDAQGRTFDRDIDASSTASNQANLDPYEDVQPTFTTHVAFAFDVAKDAHGFVLKNTDFLGDNPQTLFRLGV